MIIISHIKKWFEPEYSTLLLSLAISINGFEPEYFTFGHFWLLLVEGYVEYVQLYIIIISHIKKWF